MRYSFILAYANLPIPRVIFETQVSFPSNFASIFNAIKQLLFPFLAQTLYTLVKGSN